MNEGSYGETIRETEIPEELKGIVAEKRAELLNALADINDEIAMGLMENEHYDPPVELVRKALREATISRHIVPVFMGSAYKNKGVQQLLDGVLHYLPAPNEVENFALPVGDESSTYKLETDITKPTVALVSSLFLPSFFLLSSSPSFSLPVPPFSFSFT